MAEQMDSKARNVAFLKQMEVQRLRRPSHYTLDLRGKVAGECQAYSIGGVTHYLDDRGYLLVKQLMARFNGQYTTGVYEAVLKAIKTFPRKDEGPTIKVKQTILERDGSQVQLIALDQQFRRKESRITFSTPVEIRLSEMLYNGITLDISAIAIRVNLKRLYTLEKDDVVTVTFTELAPVSELQLLSKLKYKVLKVQHDNRRSQLILQLEEDNESLNAWWHAWVEKQQAPSKFDVDHQLLNVVSHVYQRLYNQNMNKGLIWLGQDNSEPSIEEIHLNSFSEQTIQSLLDEKDSLNSQLLPLNQLLEDNSPNYLLLIYSQNGQTTAMNAACDNSQQIQSILTRFNQVNGHLFLLQTHSQSVDLADFEQQISKIKEVDEHYAEQLARQLTRLQTLLTITDISLPCRSLNLEQPTLLANESLEQQPAIDIPRPLTLDYHIERKSQRFLIKTAISLDLARQRFELKTDDVSETGLSFTVPGRLHIAEGSLVRIHFTRWQAQTKKAKLDAVPFIIRRVQYWEGQTTFGLERNLSACGEKVNHFFASAIEENRSQLAIDRQDILSSNKAKIFSQQLLTCLNATPFFIAITPSKKRILQSVTTTQSNQAAYDDKLWQTLQIKTQAMYEYLKSAITEGLNTADFGLYSYLDSKGNWIISTEHDFKSLTQKTLFLNRALLA